MITMSNSSLVNCTVKSPNHSGARTYSIDRITPHCVVGQLSAESIGGCFDSSNVQASCNYGIGSDGRVVLCVDEAQASAAESLGVPSREFSRICAGFCGNSAAQAILR